MVWAITYAWPPKLGGIIHTVGVYEKRLVSKYGVLCQNRDLVSAILVPYAVWPLRILVFPALKFKYLDSHSVFRCGFKIGPTWGFHR